LLDPNLRVKKKKKKKKKKIFLGTSQFRAELIISSLDQVRFDHESVQIFTGHCSMQINPSM
jgi:hypothetical protein